MEDTSGKFAIHLAAREGQTSVVESLLNGNPKLAMLRDDDDRLPVHWALSNSRLPIVQILVQAKGFEPDVKDGSGWTPLMIACSLRDGEPMVDLLLSKGADVNAKNSNGQTALHFCASKNQLDLARKLIDRKATTRVKDKRGQLPLHRAASIGSVPMVQLLLEHSSPLNATDVSGMTALHHAIAEGHGDTALALLKAGADAGKEDIDGHRPLQLAPDDKVRNYILREAEREGLEIA